MVSLSVCGGWKRMNWRRNLDVGDVLFEQFFHSSCLTVSVGGTRVTESK